MHMHHGMWGEVHLDLFERHAAGENVVVPLRRPEPDLSALRQALRAFSMGDDSAREHTDASLATAIAAIVPTPAETAEVVQHEVELDAEPNTPSPPALSSTLTAELEIAQPETGSTEPVWTMRGLVGHYMTRDGKETGANNPTNVERALTLYEAVLPRGRTAPVTQIMLKRPLQHRVWHAAVGDFRQGRFWKAIGVDRHGKTWTVRTGAVRLLGRPRYDRPEAILWVLAGAGVCCIAVFTEVWRRCRPSISAMPAR